MARFLSDPAIVRDFNLYVSAFVLAIGLVFYWFTPPAAFTKYPFTERAFEFWLLKWLTYVITWGLLSQGGTPDPRWVLASVDLNSLFGLGFFWAYFKGEEYKERPALINLVFIYGLLLAWNLAFANWALKDGARGDLLQIWYFPSEIGSAGLILMGVAALLRYKKPATMFLVLTLAYVILQQPTYEILFRNVHPDPSWLLLLALGKFGYTIAFYVLCFGIPEDGQSVVPKFGLAKPLKYVLAVFGLGIIAATTLRVGDWLRQRQSLWMWLVMVPLLGLAVLGTRLLLDFLRQRPIATPNPPASRTPEG